MTPARIGEAFVVRNAPDGTTVIRSKLPLVPYPRTVCGDLVAWAARSPQALFLAERREGYWASIDYACMLARVRRIAAALLASAASPAAPLAIVAENGIEHASIALAAMYCGIPIAPLRPSVASPEADGAKLRELLTTLQPGLIFADAVSAARLSEAADNIAIVTDLASLRGDPSEADAAFARVGPATVAKIMFTSGSTGAAKGVVTTNAMLAANQTQATMVWPELGEHRPVIVDWLPWSHTMGGSHIFGLVLRNGGTLYIDDGRPVADAFAASVANLREIAPTLHFSVPRGFALLLEALTADAAFATRFFSRLRGLGNAAAALPQAVREELIRLGRRYAPQPVRVTSSWGMTESAPMATTSWGLPEPDADTIGTPIPGVELKLVPSDGRYEIRVRGPNVTAGYWRDAAATRDAFDEERFLRTGDAGALKDPADPSRGIVFEGRLAENFKLDTGTWVNVEALRLALVERGAPLVEDVVLTGHDRAYLGALIFVRRAAALALVRAPTADRVTLARHPDVRGVIARALAEHNAAAPATSTRIERALILAEPPDPARGEITAKGSLNQRRALELRAKDVGVLHARETSPDVITPAPRDA
jgi:feruloyl-CoA synthase